MIRKVRWGEVLLALGLLAVIGAMILPVLPNGYPRPKDATCLSNVKQSSLGLIMYAGDENDRFPARDLWMDVTAPYVKNEAIWHCPSAPKGAYGYAFDGALSRVKQTKLAGPATTPLIYDSVNPIRNASDLCVSLPLPGRHGRADGHGPGRNTVGYADGHAKSVVP